uniref:hypothetical protein n=1 Tax=Nocardia shimofusensis TaxID=228596 RepID=UPI000A723336
PTEVVDPNRIPLFNNAFDAEAQAHWLETAGWIRFDRTEICAAAIVRKPDGAAAVALPSTSPRWYPSMKCAIMPD